MAHLGRCPQCRRTLVHSVSSGLIAQRGQRRRSCALERASIELGRRRQGVEQCIIDVVCDCRCRGCGIDHSSAALLVAGRAEEYAIDKPHHRLTEVAAAGRWRRSGGARCQCVAAVRPSLLGRRGRIRGRARNEGLDRCKRQRHELARHVKPHHVPVRGGIERLGNAADAGDVRRQGAVGTAEQADALAGECMMATARLLVSHRVGEHSGPGVEPLFIDKAHVQVPPSAIPRTPRLVGSVHHKRET